MECRYRRGYKTREVENSGKASLLDGDYRPVELQRLGNGNDTLPADV